MRWCVFFFFLMIRRPPRSTLDRSSAASDVYKRQLSGDAEPEELAELGQVLADHVRFEERELFPLIEELSLIHISEPTRPY